MQKNKYNYLSKILHEFYLSNYFISKTSFEIESLLYNKQILNKKLGELVFITGLARAGTTSLFNAIYQTNDFASLTYANMPFLLMPNVWKRLGPKTKSILVERAHKDGILINENSPEALDEYFWKVFLNDSYILTNKLITHNINETIKQDYLRYIHLICINANKNNYLSKNNNNILRLFSIAKIHKNAKIIVVFRNPIAHAKSLLKQHLNFIELHTNDPFSLSYFNYLGHHEFGLNHKSFHLAEKASNSYNINSLNYWLQIWLNYYTYILENLQENIYFIAFEDICSNPLIVSNYLNSILNPKNKIVLSGYIPKGQKELTYDQNLISTCNMLYKDLQKKTNTVN